MAKPVGLHELITAVAGAVVEAQDQVEQHQTDILRRYFDDDGRPYSLELLLPSTSSTSGPTAAKPVAVPLIALFGTNLLRISDVTVDFQVELGDLSVPEPGLAMVSAPNAIRSGARVDVPNIGFPAAAKLAVGAAPAPPPPRFAASLRPAATLSVGLQPASGATTTKATIRMKVESQPQSEGLARLISQISQTI